MALRRGLGRPMRGEHRPRSDWFRDPEQVVSSRSPSLSSVGRHWSCLPAASGSAAPLAPRNPSTWAPRSAASPVLLRSVIPLCPVSSHSLSFTPLQQRYLNLQPPQRKQGPSRPLRPPPATPASPPFPPVVRLLHPGDAHLLLPAARAPPVLTLSFRQKCLLLRKPSGASSPSNLQKVSFHSSNSEA